MHLSSMLDTILGASLSSDVQRKMTFRSAWPNCISVSVVIVALGRASLALHLDSGAALLFPGGIAEMFLIDGFHGRRHSDFLTELCLNGVSLIFWSVVALAILALFEVIKHFGRGTK
jgi:hypothetical protein